MLAFLLQYSYWEWQLLIFETVGIFFSDVKMKVLIIWDQSTALGSQLFLQEGSSDEWAKEERSHFKKVLSTVYYGFNKHGATSCDVTYHVAN